MCNLKATMAMLEYAIGALPEIERALEHELADRYTEHLYLLARVQCLLQNAAGLKETFNRLKKNLK